jgi:hypothetical protein
MSSTLNPISKLPYDVVLEIFTHCPPRNHDHRQQPNTRIAPMLLCHVCSFWRTVALTAATLWTDLFYCFTIAADYDTDTASWTYDFVESDIQFLQWWKKDQGSIAPSIVLDVHFKLRSETTEKLAGVRMDFLIEYLTSARFLSLHPFYWEPIHDRIKAGYPVAFPNLQHLAMNFGWREDTYKAFYHVQALLPAHSLSPLRRLSISDDMDALPDNFVIPNYWSTLTHISLSKVSISLQFWFFFIRAVPNLQWGHFDMTILSSDCTTPPQCTLSQLTTLCVSVNRIRPALSFPYPLRRLVTDLHMPSLRTLSLSSPGPSWTNHRGYTNLYGALNATPSVTKLALGGNFLALHSDDTAAVLSAVPDVEPVWRRAPQLAHLQLDRPVTDDMSTEDADAALERFVRNVCAADGGWLDLRNGACPIRSITIRDTAKSRRGPDPPRRDFTLSTMEQNTKRVSEVVFQISAEFEEQFGKALRSE